MPNILIKRQKEQVIFGKIVINQDMLQLSLIFIRYIEFNPIEAGLSLKAGEYPFTLAHAIFNGKDFYSCTKESILFRDYDIEMLGGFLAVTFSQEDLTFLQKEDMIVLSKSKSLEEHFMDVKSKENRNSVIGLAYLEDGYS